MANPDYKVNTDEVHHLHVEVPNALWEEFKRIVPEQGVTSLIIRRLLQSYVNAVKDAKDTIEVRKLVI